MREKKLLGLVSGLIIICELIIFLVAYSSSGNKKWIQVKNQGGDLIYEVKGDRLPGFDKYYFENNFGPLKDYDINLIEKHVAFPVRGWLFASIALPVGLSFLFLFLIKSLSLVFPSIRDKLNITETEKILFPSKEEKGRGLIYNVYIAGAFLLVLSFLIWALPIIFNSAAQRTLFVISEYPVIFSVLFAAVFIFIMFTAFLRFRLRKYDIDKKYEIDLLKIENEKKFYLSSLKEKEDNYIENKKFIDFNGDNN